MTSPGRTTAQRLLAVVAAGVLTGCAGVAAPVGAPLEPTPAIAPAPAPSTPSVVASTTSAPAPTASPSATAAAQSVRAPRIKGVLNFRDAAGWKTSLKLSGGATMAHGVVYRSGRLKDLTKADRKELVRTGITDIVDLRTTQVIRRSPDPSITGAKYRHINIFGVYSTGSPRYSSEAKAIAARKKMYRQFVTDSGQRKRTASVLKVIAKAKGPVIIHCSEGKDRTGWIAAVLQLTAGASRSDVMREYLLSNQLREDAITARYNKVRKASGTKAAKIDRRLYIVDDAYLNASLKELDRRYGDLDTFLTKGLGLSKSTVASLRDKLRDD